MPKSSPTHPDCFALHGELTIYHAESLKAQVLAEMENKMDLEIDLRGVTEMDSAGIQLLMAAKKEAQRRGQQLRLSGHSRPVLDLFELLNLSAFFGDQLLLAAGDNTHAAKGSTP